MPLAPPPAPLYGAQPPVYGQDFPDPTIVNPCAAGQVCATGSEPYLGFSTNASYGGLDVPLVPTAISPDLRSWSRSTPTDALARPPAWQDYFFLQSKNWAPAVHQFGATWVLYFTAPYPATGDQCIGAATSSLPQGPYQPIDAGPIECDFGIGGSIDPNVVVDASGQAWLLWKTDGNCCDLPAVIRSQALSADGLSLVGSPHDLLGVDQAWEDGSGGGAQPWKKVVEGPAMVASAGTYYLFYSANWYDSASSAIGYATCSSPAGPCVKPHDGPLLGNGPGGAGPSGPDTFVDASGQRWLVYAAWSPSAPSYETGGTRTMRLSRLDLSQGAPVLGGGP